MAAEESDLLLSQLREDYPLYFERCLKIKDKQARVIPFVLNPSQKQLVEIVEMWEDRYPNGDGPTLYIIILKARQIGFSTCTEAIFFKRLNFSFNQTAMVVSYDEGSAQNINEISDLFYQHLPQVVKPVSRSARGKGLLFENPAFRPSQPESDENDPGLQSKFLIETAGNMSAGSSFTINMLHISELAKWPDPDKTMTSLMQAVPDKGAIVIVESTANGMNYFQELWSQTENGENNYIPVFVPWFEHEEYTAPYTDFELTEYEGKLQEVYRLTLDQLQWRRNTIKDKLKGDEQFFKQEYPNCSLEAFLTTGSPVFDNEQVIFRLQYLRELYEQEPERARVGSIVFDTTDEGDPIKGTQGFVEDPNGWLRVYEAPKPRTPYVIGGDTAEGGIDFSVGQVLNNITGAQAATFRAHTDTDLYAKQMCALGWHYNEALVGPEINFDLHPVKELQRLHYRKMYYRETMDSITRKPQKKYGWQTTHATRGPMIGDLVAIVRETIELINDLDTLGEMLTFVRSDVGRPEAQNGKHDDCVMALAIAHRIRDQQRSSLYPSGEIEFPADMPEDDRKQARTNIKFAEEYLKIKKRGGQGR